jgi:fibronectin-binding autotransporter adhesin
VVSVSTLAALGQSSDEAVNLSLNGGSLRFAGASGGNTNRLFTLGPNGGTLDAGGPAAMAFGGTGGLAFATPNTTTTLTLTGTGTGALAATLGDNGAGKTALIKTGTGAWSLSGANTFSGAVVVQQGTLWLARAGAGGANAAYTLSAGVTLAVGSGRSDTVVLGSLAGDGTVTASRAGGSNEINTLSVGGDGTSTAFAGVLRNTDHVLALVKTGAGTLTLTGTNSYTGTTTVSAGVLRVGNGGKSGSIVGAVANDAALAFDRSDDLTFGGAITGSGTLTKAGAGTLTLTGTSAYTGATRVTAGTLLVNGALGKSDVTVGAGAALGGSGTIDPSTVTVSTSGTIFGGGRFGRGREADRVGRPDPVPRGDAACGGRHRRR